jgi:hypothetical protein
MYPRRDEFEAYSGVPARATPSWTDSQPVVAQRGTVWRLLARVKRLQGDRTLFEYAADQPADAAWGAGAGGALGLFRTFQVN